MANTGGEEGLNKTKKVESNGMALIVSKKKVNESSDEPATFSSDSGPAIKMPALSSVITENENGTKPSAVSTNMIVSASNPFQSSKGSTKGTIVSLKLSDENGTELVVNNTKEPFIINIPAQTPARKFQADVSLLGVNYHKLYLPTNSSSLHIAVMPEVDGDYYHIYVKYSVKKVIEVYPDEASFDYAYTVPSNRTELDYEARHTVFMRANETMGNGTYYVGVKLAGEVFFFFGARKIKKKFFTFGNK